MADINISDILTAIEKGVGSLAGSTVPGFESQAETDAGDFLDLIKADLQRWASELANKVITQDEFSSLLLGAQNLLQMAALTKAGAKQANLDSFKSGLLALIKDVVTALI
jgi:hypothetical protein